MSWSECSPPCPLVPLLVTSGPLLSVEADTILSDSAPRISLLGCSRDVQILHQIVVGAQENAQVGGGPSLGTSTFAASSTRLRALWAGAGSPGREEEARTQLRAPRHLGGQQTGSGSGAEGNRGSLVASPAPPSQSLWAWLCHQQDEQVGFAEGSREPTRKETGVQAPPGKSCLAKMTSVAFESWCGREEWRELPAARWSTLPGF